MNAVLTPKDFATSQEVRWCPGCGDYAILKAVQKALADVGATPESTAFISGIGCASRFPYYVNSYGFHTIHGRAPALATGLKLANPDLDVWVVTGDGDGLSIGGNHLLHALRRNVDINILLFNNEIYGLTKGQYSPTSRVGTRSPSSPAGSLDTPVSPGQFVLGAGGHFFARAIDTDKAGMSHVLEAVHAHTGTAFVEIFQNCIVYNENVFADFTDRRNAANTQLHLRHGEPMLFGDGKGIRFNPTTYSLDVVDADDDVLVHDETNAVIARLLIDLKMPVALGILFRQPVAGYSARFYAEHPTRFERTKSVADYLAGPNPWVVE
ncbi:MAG: 2-oxoacid:ferredoxin oxidoreductase subunit beta [Woeseiaceae bacterium]|jgi:2-oxoglutarate ferredoxin oxidoreductase subunit beta|nr:2-oxoacid:ferredoxin oxidoreductase subunit beta [Woeseiaceae bacterium]